jgi:hypothetical protein
MKEKITELFWDSVYFIQDKWHESKRNKIIMIFVVVIILSLIFS